MGERKQLVIPQKYKDKYGNYFPIWSYSKIGSYHNCLYEYYLTRIKKIKSEDNIYSVCGSCSHDILEDLYNGKINYKDMVSKFEEDFLDVEISDYKFSSDEERNLSMLNRYKSSIIHFFRNHNIVNSKVLSEKEIWVDLDGNVFIGYVDVIHKEVNNYIITDYKTSSISEFQGEKLKDKQKQLLLYALGLNQLGIALDNIKIRWNFLKYTNILCSHVINVTYMEKDKIKTSCAYKEQLINKIKTQLKKDIAEYYTDKSTKEIKSMLDVCIEENSLNSLPIELQNKYVLSEVVKVGERCKWVEGIKSQLKKDLKNEGFEDYEIEMMLVDCINNNSIDSLPLHITKNYILDDCYIYGEVNQENINNLCEEMTKDIKDIKTRGKDESNWQIKNITKEMEYYCNVLCGVKKHCKYYSQYLESLKENELEKEDIDLLTELENL